MVRVLEAPLRPYVYISLQLLRKASVFSVKSSSKAISHTLALRRGLSTWLPTSREQRVIATSDDMSRRSVCVWKPRNLQLTIHNLFTASCRGRPTQYKCRLIRIQSKLDRSQRKIHWLGQNSSENKIGERTMSIASHNIFCRNRCSLDVIKQSWELRFTVGIRHVCLFRKSMLRVY